MLVKDLLILFQACNEGVINVLGKTRHCVLSSTTAEYSREYRALL